MLLAVGTNAVALVHLHSRMHRAFAHTYMARHAARQLAASTHTTTLASHPPSFISHVNQPNPTIDPFTKNVYWVGVLQTAEVTQHRIYCVAGSTGAACPGFSDLNGNNLNVQAAFNNVAGCVLHYKEVGFALS